MKTILAAMAAVLLISSAGVATAATDPSTTTPAAPGAGSVTPAAKDDSNKMVCKSEPVTGSRLEVHTRCFTKAEWEEIRRSQQNSLSTAQQNAQDMSPEGH